MNIVFKMYKFIDGTPFGINGGIIMAWVAVDFIGEWIFKL